jgi:hypothetical protein
MCVGKSRGVVMWWKFVLTLLLFVAFFCAVTTDKARKGEA